MNAGWQLFFTTLAVVLVPSFVRGDVKLTDVTVAKGLGNYNAVPGDGHAPGAVFNDLNNDGYPDLYLVGARDYGADVYLPNRLFLNMNNGVGGRTFVEVSNAAGADNAGAHNGAISADYDNDGDQDLYVINWYDNDDPNYSMPLDKNRLYRNNLNETGSLSFTDVTDSTDPTPGVSDDQHGVGWATAAGNSVNQSLTAAWSDPDRDGDLDLYVGTHHGWIGWGGGLPGQRDTFYMNNGDGTFTDMTVPLGLEGFETSTGAHDVPGVQSYSSTNAVIFADFNNDQWPDLLVSNKVGGSVDRDMLYVNQGADAAGNWLGYSPVTYTLPSPFGNRTAGAMGVDVADVDNDGDLDFYLTDWSNPANFPPDGSSEPPDGANDLWINQLSETGTLDFIRVSGTKSVFSWGIQFVDFDNNGFQDLHVATDAGVRDSLYLNSAAGFSAEVALASGLTETFGGRGDVSADYNRDGLTDLLVVNPWGTGRSVLYENQSDTLSSSANNGYLVFKLEGDPDLPGKFKSSRDAIGARVYVTADLDNSGSIEPHERMIREVVSGSSNAASTSSLELEFGTGLATTALVEVLWPSGRTTTMTFGVDQFVTLKEILADLDGNGEVNHLDMALWELNYGLGSGATHAEGDTDLDGDVDGIDFLNLQASMGSLSHHALIVAAAQVPEPGSAGLSLLLLMCGCAARTRKMGR